MKLNLITLAKIYIVFFGLVHFDHVVSLLGINETMVSAPPYLNFWWWHFILFLVYGALPLIAILIDNEKSCLAVTGISLIGILMGVLNMFPRIMDFYLIFAFLDSLATIFSLFLAVENVASEVSAEILGLEWSQF